MKLKSLRGANYKTLLNTHIPLLILRFLEIKVSMQDPLNDAKILRWLTVLVRKL